MLVKLAVDVLEQEHYNNRRHLQQQITSSQLKVKAQVT